MEETKRTTSTLEINTSYYTGATARVTFKDGKTWADVKDWYIKWDTLHVLFKDAQDYEEFALESHTDADSTDWKRPISVSIHPRLDDGSTDYDIDYAATK